MFEGRAAPRAEWADLLVLGRDCVSLERGGVGRVRSAWLRRVTPLIV